MCTLLVCACQFLQFEQIFIVHTVITFKISACFGFSDIEMIAEKSERQNIWKTWIKILSSFRYIKIQKFYIFAS